MYIYIYRGWGGKCFPVPAPPTFGDKILSPSPSPNIVLYPRSKRGGSPQGPVPVDNIVIPNCVVHNVQ